MTYFLIAVLTVIVVTVLVFHVVQARDWREERAYLLNAAISKNGTEFVQRVNPVPADGPAVEGTHQFWSQVEGYEAPIGL